MIASLVQSDSEAGSSSVPDGNAAPVIRQDPTASRNATDPAVWLDDVARRVAAHVDAASLRIWSLDKTRQRLQLTASVGISLPFEALQDDLPVAQSELGQVVTTGHPFVVDCDAAATPPDVRQWAARSGVVSFLAVPVSSNGQSLGVLAAFTRSPDVAEQQRVLTDTAEQVGACWTHHDASGRPSTQVPDLPASLIPCLSSALVTLDRDGLITRWSRTAERLFGWSENEVLGKPLPIVPEDRVQEFTLDGNRDAQAVHRGQTVCQRADQSFVDVQRTSAPLFDRDGEVIGRIELFADDSQRVRISKCLQVQAQVARILAGCRGRDDAVALLLTALGEWLGCDAFDFWSYDANERTLTRAGVWARLSQVRDRLTAMEIRLKAGDSEWPAQALQKRGLVCEDGVIGPSVSAAFPSLGVLQASIAGLAIPVRHDDECVGIISGFSPTLVEPDELTRQTLQFAADAFAQFLMRLKSEEALAKSEAQLRQTQKMDAIGLLAGGVAHDFNNLLTIILAYSEMGLEEVGPESPLHEIFSEVHGAGERAAAMTRQLLAVSRQQPSQVVTCNVNQLVTDMDKMLRRLIGPDITLVCDCEEGLGNVQADFNQLEQVLLNLVVNARDAMPEGGTISVVTRNVTKTAAETRRHDAAPGPYVELQVSDTGCGMDETTLTRIFEPFFTTKDVGRGTGMGLSTVFGIIKQSGGYIAVESEVGIGTTFHVLLPESRRSLAMQTVDQHLEASPVGTETILVVENDAAVRALVRRLLEVRGYTVHEAAHGGEALRILNTRKMAVDLVLSDLQMPVVDGRALARELQGRPKGPKLLLTSANSEPPADLDIDPQRQFLPKPFTSENLARQVRRVLDSPRPSAGS